MRKQLFFMMILVLINLLVLETFTRMIVVHAKPTLGKTNTYDRKYQMAQQDTDGPEILLLGDSIIDFAVYPELLEVLLAEKGMQVKVRNLASPGATPMMNLLLLKEVVENSGKPKLVVFNFYPRIFNRNDTPDEFDATFTQSYLWRCQAEESQNLMEKAKCALEKNIALVRYRSFLKGEFEKLPKTLFQFEKRMKTSQEGSPETEVSPKGWAPGYTVYSSRTFYKEYKDNQKYTQVQGSELGNYEWTEDRFKPLMDYCQQQNIPLLVVWLPEHGFMEQYYQQQRLSHTKMANHLKQMADSGKIHFLDMGTVELSDIEYADLDHANTLGAIEITKQMAQMLQSPVYRKLTQSENNSSI